MLTRFIAAALAMIVMPLAAQEDTVNERLPADRAAIERHWGVDCPAAIADARQLLAVAERLPDAELSPRLERLATSLRPCVLLDRRGVASEGRHGRVAGAIREWRESLESGRESGAREARRALARTLERDFDLNQGRSGPPGL